jgi:hypothetical protein
MQLTNIQVLNAVQALSSLGQNKLPFKLAWRVTTALRSLEPFAKAVDEPMKDIRTKYALRDDAGNFVEAIDKDGNNVPNTVQIPNDKIALVNKEMEDLLAQTVEVHNVEFKLSEFPESLELEPNVLNALTPLINEEPAPDLKLVQ